MVTAISSRTLPPQLLAGRYRLLKELGKGGFSCVWLAEDCCNQNSYVAIKQLHQDALSIQMRAVARQNYRREAALLGHLSHARIPRLHDHSLDGKLLYLILDYIDGVSLDTYLAQQNSPLPLHEVLDLGLQLCDVLQYLHTHHPSIKYRDLKPANIMRQASGSLMLIDFGLACPLQPEEMDLAALGTAGYAAPEQYPYPWGQQTSTLQSDIYSLGVIFHQLVSGKDPTNKPIAERFTFSLLADKTSPLLAALIAHMLIRKPVQRIGSIQEVKQVLQEIATAKG